MTVQPLLLSERQEQISNRNVPFVYCWLRDVTLFILQSPKEASEGFTPLELKKEERK